MSYKCQTFWLCWNKQALVVNMIYWLASWNLPATAAQKIPVRNLILFMIMQVLNCRPKLNLKREIKTDARKSMEKGSWVDNIILGWTAYHSTYVASSFDRKKTSEFSHFVVSSKNSITKTVSICVKILRNAYQGIWKRIASNFSERIFAISGGFMRIWIAFFTSISHLT